MCLASKMGWSKLPKNAMATGLFRYCFSSETTQSISSIQISTDSFSVVKGFAIIISVGSQELCFKNQTTLFFFAISSQISPKLTSAPFHQGDFQQHFTWRMEASVLCFTSEAVSSEKNGRLKIASSNVCVFSLFRILSLFEIFHHVYFDSFLVVLGHQLQFCQSY